MSLIVAILLVSIIVYSFDEQKARQDELDKIKKLVLDERKNTFDKAVARIKSLQKTEGKSKETVARQAATAKELFDVLTEENKREGFDKYDLSGLGVSSAGAPAAGRPGATGKSAEPAASWYTKWYYLVPIIVLLLMMIGNVVWKKKESMTWRGIKGVGGFGKDTIGMIMSKVPGVGKRKEKIKKAAEEYLKVVAAKEQKILEESLLITRSIRHKQVYILANIEDTNRLISLNKDLGKIVKSHLLTLTEPNKRERKAVDVKGVGHLKPIRILDCLDALKIINDEIGKDLNELIKKLIDLKAENNTKAAAIEQQVIRLKSWVERPGINAAFNTNSEILTKLKAANTALGGKLAEIKAKITEADKKINELNGKITADINKISSKQDLLIEQERSGYKHVRELIEKKTGEYALAAQTMILNIAIALKNEFGKEDKKFYEEFTKTNTEIKGKLEQVGRDVAGVMTLSENAFDLWKISFTVILIRNELTKSGSTIVTVNPTNSNKEINYKEFSKIITRLRDAKNRVDNIEIKLDKEFGDILLELFIEYDANYRYKITAVAEDKITLTFTYADNSTKENILEGNDLINLDSKLKQLNDEIDKGIKNKSGEALVIEIIKATKGEEPTSLPLHKAEYNKVKNKFVYDSSESEFRSYSGKQPQEIPFKPLKDLIKQVLDDKLTAARANRSILNSVLEISSPNADTSINNFEIACKIYDKHKNEFGHSESSMPEVITTPGTGKIAVIGNIHANVQAFNAVLTDIESKGISEIYSCGDVLGYGVNPNECLRMIKERGVKFVVGEHDLRVLDDSYVPSYPFEEYEKLAIRWQRTKLDAELKTFLEGKKTSLKIFTGNIAIVHSELTEPDKFLRLDLATNRLDIIKTNFEIMKANHIKICFVAHTQIPSIWYSDFKADPIEYKYNKIEGLKAQDVSKVALLINVGAVGLSSDGNNKASYAIFERDTQKLDMVRLQYNINEITAAIDAAATSDGFNQNAAKTIKSKLVNGR